MLGFLLLAAAVLTGAADAPDRAAVIWLRHADQPGGSSTPISARNVMVDITALGSKAVLGTIGMLVCGLLAVLRRWRDLAFLAATLGGGLELSAVLKVLFGRVRPDFVQHIVEESSASFPSGHATYSALAVLAFSMLAFGAVASPAARAWIALAGVTVVLLVGFSRVYLGVHYPSDVLAGWCIGAAWALACRLAIRRRLPA